MNKKILLLASIGVLFTGCAIVKDEVPKNEEYNHGITLTDGRVVHSTFEVRYNNDYLSKLLSDGQINIDDFIAKLNFVSDLNDGGSKLYKYEDTLKFSGISSYYVLSCNSADGIKDVFIAKNSDNLNNMCNLKIDDLEGVSMKVKDGTLSNKGLTVVITDTSDRENIYGAYYRIEEFKNNEWVSLTPKIDMTFNEMGLYPDDNNTLELDINWLSYYGRLKSGNYRVVKKTSIKGEGTEHFITAEFRIK